MADNKDPIWGEVVECEKGIAAFWPDTDEKRLDVLLIPKTEQDLERRKEKDDESTE